MPKYTIITPMFNSFELMDNYFESILNQTYKDFEVIIVDDFSTDNSFEKAIEYTKQLPVNVTVLQSDRNAGPGNARNIGLDRAAGEYVTFVDSDDWVDFKLLEEVDNILNQYPVNCVIFDYYLKTDKAERACSSMYTGKEGMVGVSQCISYLRNHSVGKVYRRECIQSVRFPDIRRCEDLAFVCFAVEACGSAYYMAKPLYYYYQRHTSLSNNTNMDESDLIKSFSIVEDKLYNKYPNEIMEKSIPDLLYGVLLMMCKSDKSRVDVISYIQSYEKQFPFWFNCDIINYLPTPKKLFLRFARFHIIFPLKIYSRLHEILL